MQVLLWFVFAVTAVGHAARGLADEPPPYERCREQAVSAAHGTVWLELSASDSGEGVARSRARLSWSEGEGELRVRLQMLAPEELAGSAILLVEPLDTDGSSDPDAWVYLPEIDAVRRVGGRHLRKPLFGTNLRYEDLERLRDLAAQGEADSWAEARHAGRPVWRIQARDGRTRLTTWLDRERCIPLRTEVSDARGRLLRWVQVSPRAADPESPVFVPETVVVRDVYAETQTRVRVEALDLAAVPETIFDPAFLATPLAVPASLGSADALEGSSSGL